jgi:hypothetical protein
MPLLSIAVRNHMQTESNIVYTTSRAGWTPRISKSTGYKQSHASHSSGGWPHVLPTAHRLLEQSGVLLPAAAAATPTAAAPTGLVLHVHLQTQADKPKSGTLTSQQS